MEDNPVRQPDDANGSPFAPDKRPFAGNLSKYARPALIVGVLIAVVCIALLIIIFFLDSFNAATYSMTGKSVQDATDEAGTSVTPTPVPASQRSSGWWCSASSPSPAA
ncbi:hypothetical protein AHiyo8_51880 [Arthrobacter sp. Hiyo8]|nr:hypothetical protein AHiyo8_51880 [Arthrobacter sp. Hiyo8]